MKNNNFDSLRLIFAVLVIFSHSYPLLRGSNATEPLSMLTHGQVNFGNISVWAFFAISGFLITQSWQRSPRILKFLKRRICRIYPAFMVTAILSAIIVVPMAAERATYYRTPPVGFMLDTLRLRVFDSAPVFVHNPFPMSLNGSLWSVQYEFWCYLGIAALGLMGLLRRRTVIVVIFALTMGVHLIMDVTGWAPAGNMLGQIFGYPPIWFTVLPFYLAGALFYLYGGQSILNKRWAMAAAIALVTSNYIPHGFVITAPICGSYLLMALAYWPALHPFNLGRYGDFSYGIYLYAFPVQQLLVQHVPGQTTPVRLFLEAAPISILLGALSWFLVERNFLGRRSQVKYEGVILPPDTVIDSA